MKKNIIPLLVCLSVPALGLAQSLSPTVVATSGGSDQNAQVSLEWTLGEAAVETVSAPGRIFSQGFHQPLLLVEEMPEPASPYRIEVAPNPVVSVLNVSIASDEDASLRLNLTDIRGKTVYELPAKARSESLQLDMQQLPAGLYLLRMSNAQGQSVKTYKIIKQ